MKNNSIDLFNEKPIIPLDLIHKWVNLVNLVSKVIPGAIVWINGKDHSNISPKQISLEEVTEKWGDLCQQIITNGKNFFLSNPKLGTKSFLGFPLLWPDKDVYGSLCIIEPNKDVINELNTGILQDFADQFTADLALYFHQNQLKTQVGERKKELNLLYFLTEISFIPNLSVEDILLEIVHKIPTGWQYPEVTCAQIVLNDNTYQTDNFKETPWVQIADILTDGKKNGKVAVYYLKEMPPADEGPFLTEERDLINGIVRLLNFTIKEKITNETLAQDKLFSDSFIGAVPGLFFVLDPNDRFIRWNKNLHEITGYSGKELRCKHFKDILLEEEKDRFIDYKAGLGRIFNIQTQQFQNYYFQFEMIKINDQNYLIGVGTEQNSEVKHG